jgi:hypothetical protein
MKKLFILFIFIILILPGTMAKAQKITDLGAATSISSNDLIIVHKYPFTTSSTQKLTWAEVLANMGAGVFSSVTVSDATNDNRIRITNNTSRSPGASVNELYPEGNIWKVNENGTEKIMVKYVSVPASPTAAGEAGEISADGSYFYICYGTNTWIRIAKGAW